MDVEALWDLLADEKKEFGLFKQVDSKKWQYFLFQEMIIMATFSPVELLIISPGFTGLNFITSQVSLSS